MTDHMDAELVSPAGKPLPQGEIRVAENFLGGNLCLHIDADDPDHPLEKKAIMWGKPVRVRR